MQQDLTALNKQAIAAAQQHMGNIAWGTVALTFTVVTLFIANFWLLATGLLPVWAALLFCALLTYMSYTPLHEAAHGNIHGRHEKFKWLNDLCGYLCAPIIMVPYSTHRVEHFTHHRYTNQPGKDPDYVVKTMGDTPLAFIVTGIRFLWVQNTFLFKDYWATASKRERRIFFAEEFFSIGWRLAILVILPLHEGLTVIVLGYFAGAFFTAYWFAYRPHLPYEEPARYRNTNSLLMPRWMKPLEWFWLGQNLHSIHHLFPRVPFYKYHALHREIAPIMRAHGTPMIGIFDRQPID